MITMPSLSTSGCVCIVLGIFLGTIQYSHQPSLQPNKSSRSRSHHKTYISPSGTRCISCGVGKYVIKHCNKLMPRSRCRLCPPGTFSNTVGGATSCQWCKTCSHGVDVISECTSIHNTVCGCPEGSVPNYIDGWIQNCEIDQRPISSSPTDHETTTKSPVSSGNEYEPRTTTNGSPNSENDNDTTEQTSSSDNRPYISPIGIKCFGCGVGKYVIKHCIIPMTRSNCTWCPTGTFSNTVGGATSCQSCMPCSIGVTTISECTSIHNTVCACPEGSVPNDPDGWILNCIKDQTPISSSPTDHKTTTKSPLSSDNEYEPRTTTNGSPNSENDNDTTEQTLSSGEIIVWIIVVFFVGVVAALIIRGIIYILTYKKEYEPVKRN